LAALGVGTASAISMTTSGTAAAAPKALSGTTLALVLKWLGVGATTGVLCAGAAQGIATRGWFERPSAPVSTVSTVRSPAPRKIANQPMRLASTASAASVEPASPSPARSSEPQVVAPPVVARAPFQKPTSDSDPAEASRSPSVSQLAREVAALDAARTALAAGEPRRALGLLDAYAQNFPRGELAPESTLLRVQALLAAGQRKTAEKLAHDLLARHPADPLARKLERLLAGTASH
jgi:hypothetical protein